MAFERFKETIGDLAAATPPNRDRYVDLLRALSIVTVVVGHYVIALIHWEDGRIFVHNAVGHQSGLWLATWVLQVMPLFFFVGGFSNDVGWRSTRDRGGSVGEFLRKRVTRLVRPTAVFLAVWVVVEAVLRFTGSGAAGTLRSTFLPFGPMWFLVVYIAVVALAPITVEWHDRHGWKVPAALAALVAVVDLVRFGFDVPGIGWVNLLLVWVAVHQVGYLYADGSLVAAGKRAWRAMIIGGLALLIVLTNLELFTSQLHYPRSMVGVDIEPVSNMSPPSLAIIALATWQIGLAMFLRARANRWLQRATPWKATIAVNSLIMTLFLWHLSALLIVILLLHPHGFGVDTEPTARWWIERPLWVLAPLAVLAPIVAIFRGFERSRS